MSKKKNNNNSVQNKSLDEVTASVVETSEVNESEVVIPENTDKVEIPTETVEDIISAGEVVTEPVEDEPIKEDESVVTEPVEDTVKEEDVVTEEAPKVEEPVKAKESAPVVEKSEPVLTTSNKSGVTYKVVLNLKADKIDIINRRMAKFPQYKPIVESDGNVYIGPFSEYKDAKKAQKTVFAAGMKGEIITL